jgi:hypothetical protein
MHSLLQLCASGLIRKTVLDAHLLELLHCSGPAQAQQAALLCAVSTLAPAAGRCTSGG